ncbi:MAG: 2-oxoacid:acceptor oxidoreductase family protein [Kiritimatiellia bacterium]
MIEVRWHGRGGQGGFTAARLLGMAAALFEGRFALAFPAFGPERRGAPVLGFTRIDDRKVTDRSAVTACDIVVVLDDTLLGPGVVKGLRAGGVVVVNTARQELLIALPEGGRLVRADAAALALDVLGKPIANTAMLGVLAAATGVVSLSSIEKAVRHEMPAKLAELNVALLRKAAESL